MHTLERQGRSEWLRSTQVRFAVVGMSLLGFGMARQIWLQPTPQTRAGAFAPRAATQESGPLADQEQRRVITQAARRRALDAYATLPLTFIANAGQLDPQVRFYAQEAGYGFYLTPQEAVFAFFQEPSLEEVAAAADVRGVSESTEAPVTRGVALGLRFIGAKPEVVIEGQQRTQGVVNYFMGNDPAQWRSGVATYQQVLYRELWPGIDLALRREARQLKYEFRVRPGARVEDIGLSYRGAESLAVDGVGNLRIGTALGELSDSRPVSYQPIGGQRVPVESRYVLRRAAGASEYGFSVASYEHRYPLVIDPGLDYSTFLGGEFGDSGPGLAVDAAGNAYVAGSTDSPDFPTTRGAFDRTLGSSFASDVFITKLDPAGSALIYSTFLGGQGFDGGLDLAVDAAGNAYVTGFTESSDFPTTPGAFDRSFNGGSDDVFITKLNSDGSALVYSTFLGGGSVEQAEQGLDLAVNVAGNAYVTGFTESPDFPTTPGAFDRRLGGFMDLFITKLNPAGSALVYSTLLGGGELEQFSHLAVDAAGNTYLTGNTQSRDFPTTPGAFDRTLGGFTDAVITKLNPAGSALVYSSFLGGGEFDQGRDLAVDGAGNAYVTGGTFSPDFPTTPGALDRTFSGGVQDVFVTKLNPAGSALVYSTFLGGGESELGIRLAVDAAGSAHVTGGTFSADFPTTPGAFDRSFNGGSDDAFITKLNPDASALVYSTFLGGAFGESGRGLAVDATGNAYVTGSTESPDFPTTPDAFDRTFNGDLDAFITKLPLGAEALCDGRPATLVGTDANDVLIGTDGDDVIAGLGGNDGIRGRGGDDLICGGLGADVIEGGGGRDVLFGQAGVDLLDGGPGADQLIGDKGDDTLLGKSGPDELYGGTGDDELNGGSESDFCVGGPNDTADTAVNCEAVQGVP